VAQTKSKTVRRRGKNGETAAKSVNFGPLATWIGFNLRMAQEATFQAFSHLSQEIGESPGRFGTLTLISRNPGISQTELSQANGRDKSSRPRWSRISCDAAWSSASAWRRTGAPTGSI
jgi:hypothetical protein